MQFDDVWLSATAGLLTAFNDDGLLLGASQSLRTANNWIPFDAGAATEFPQR